VSPKRRESCDDRTMFLPRSRCRIEIPIGRAAFAERLGRITASTQPWFRFVDWDHEFIGVVSAEGFRLTPAIRRRNTYLPRVIGRIESDGARDFVELRQALHPLAIGIVLLMFLPIGFAVLGGDLAAAFTFFAMLVAAHTLLYFFGFRPEARRVEARLRELAS
jgi:hypothetical protein